MWISILGWLLKSCSPRCARSARAQQKKVRQSNQELNQELIPLKAWKSKTQVYWVLKRYMCLQARVELTLDLILPRRLPQTGPQTEGNFTLMSCFLWWNWVWVKIRYSNNQMVNTKHIHSHLWSHKPQILTHGHLVKGEKWWMAPLAFSPRRG